MELYDDPHVGGIPASSWYADFCWCYSITEIGFIFNGWPNGQPLEDQEMMMINVFGEIKDELTMRIKKKRETEERKNRWRTRS